MNEKKSLILMVEDEEQVLNTNCRMLRRRGYDVRTAQTAAEAYHQLEEQLPDLLILDIMLPDGNGLDICRRFREKTMNPVLFLTGKSACSHCKGNIYQRKYNGISHGNCLTYHRLCRNKTIHPFK